MTFMKLGCAIILTLTCGAEARDLTGALRSAFIANSTEQCISSQSAMAVNRNMSLALIRVYCTCIMEKVADRITFEDAQKSTSPRVEKITSDASAACGVELSNIAR